MISEPSVLRQKMQAFVPPASPPGGGPVAGAPGRQQWTFEPLAQGAAHVRFEYRQPWMLDQAPAWTVDLEVAVGGEGDG